MTLFHGSNVTVEQAKHIGGYTLELIFNNGEKRKFDFSSLLDKGVCSKLRDMDYFKNFRVDAFSVDWNNEIGFAPEFLYENGAAIRNWTLKNMHKTEGYWNVEPKIKALSFPKRGKFQVDLIDGRSITMPISAFPSMKKVPVRERNDWYLMGGGVTWDSCPEVIHIEQILGNYQNYAHER